MQVVELLFLVPMAIKPWEGVHQPYYPMEVVQRMCPEEDLLWRVEA
jgi:hypothetical protein